VADPAVSTDVAPAEQPTARPAKGSRSGRPDIRFGIAYLALAALVGAAVGFFIVFLDQPSEKGSTKGLSSWSDWQPERSGELGAKEIATHVSARYRLDNGNEMVRVVAERPQIQNVQMNFSLIQPRDAQSPKDTAVLEIGNGIMYQLCGLGKNCAIEGKPTLERYVLLRREATELALLTFKYDSDVRTVLNILPPVENRSLAMVFRRRDVADELSHPLAATLPVKGRLHPGQIPNREVQTIDRISQDVLFGYRVNQALDGTPILVLDPL